MTSMTVVNRASGGYTWHKFSKKKKLPALEPHKAYYALLPVTVPFDLVTLPVQVPVYIFLSARPDAEKTE
jgi:hypothetical protein